MPTLFFICVDEEEGVQFLRLKGLIHLSRRVPDIGASTSVSGVALVVSIGAGGSLVAKLSDLLYFLGGRRCCR